MSEALLQEKEYVIYCDESDRKGKYYSNFYGGVRVPGSIVNRVEQRLRDKIAELGITSEVKWAKVSEGVVDRYAEFIAAFFAEVASGNVTVRVMFTHNIHVPEGLTPEHYANEYFILYYQFLKHGFGIQVLPPHAAPPKLRIYLDEIGTTKEQVATFRGYVKGGLTKVAASSPAGGVCLLDEDITEVRSHSHAIMQALDVILGSITFRLNDKHLEKLPGTKRRGRRTVAKERLYKIILRHIKHVSGRPHFNIGISTGRGSAAGGLWSESYLHWEFIPRARSISTAHVKSRKKESPTDST